VRPHSTAQQRMVQCSTAHGTAGHAAAQSSAAQHPLAQQSVNWLSTAQHNTMQLQSRQAGVQCGLSGMSTQCATAAPAHQPRHAARTADPSAFASCHVPLGLSFAALTLNMLNC
jgi:hypothetical protein